MKRAAALACLPILSRSSRPRATPKTSRFSSTSRPTRSASTTSSSSARSARSGSRRSSAGRPRPTRAPILRRDVKISRRPAKAGAKVVVSIGFEFNDMLPDVATAYPNVKFLQVDSCPFDKMKPNIHCSVFREYEASFLTGAEAALTTKTGKVGAISALDIPFLHRYTDGFIEGAKHVKPDVQISPTLWVGGNNPFSDPARGQERGAAMVADGADRILAAGAGSNGGIFKAVQDASGVNAFGVDVNQCPQAPGAVMDNVEKKTDVAVELAVKGIMAGSQPPIAALGLKEGGMSLTALDPDVKASKCTIADYPDVIAKVKALRDEIVNGSIKIADPMTAK